MMLKTRTPLLIALSSLLLTACAGAPVEQKNKTAINNANTSTQSAKTGWQLENSPLSANREQFVKQVSQRYGIPETYVQNLLNNAQYNERVARLIMPQGPKGRIKRVWPSYRARFVEPVRLQQGTEFWEANRSALARAESQYGVPAAVIASIIGVETVYGRYMGSFRMLDALYTLGFNHPDASRPEKSQMFRNQLAALINLDYQGKLNALHEEGSFAGATGLPQFMPISILHYAIDGDKNGKIDLRNSTEDAIMSVANFLVKHGWQKNTPIFAPVRLPANPAALVDGGLEPYLSWEQLQSSGATLSNNSNNSNWKSGKQLGVINLPDEIRGQTEYRTATPNFFAITKYNRSYFYATAVADLAQALAQKQRSNGYNVIFP
ncbi:lytic murein transglycosylase B [Advenella alkanexedens]|uniref:lytic murein transglycosylase B n=1 Tax=Advenella alkanexedens TaxID=1481665 RepID=UPI002674CFD1|nr:lytic murein transglycosylase B [Advenella alkanexedens]WKU18229.1 lytic murein transglycosylase B [Advenella alkanexedens]